MGKVKLTSEQANALKYVLESYYASEIVIKHARAASDEDKWIGKAESLNELTMDFLIKALYIGYEVEYTPEELVKQYYDTVKEFWKDEKFYDQKEKYWGEIRGIEHTLKF